MLRSFVKTHPEETFKPWNTIELGQARACVFVKILLIYIEQPVRRGGFASYHRSSMISEPENTSQRLAL